MQHCESSQQQLNSYWIFHIALYSRVRDRRSERQADSQMQSLMPQAVAHRRHTMHVITLTLMYASRMMNSLQIISCLEHKRLLTHCNGVIPPYVIQCNVCAYYIQ